MASGYIEREVRIIAIEKAIREGRPHPPAGVPFSISEFTEACCRYSLWLERINPGPTHAKIASVGVNFDYWDTP